MTGTAGTGEAPARVPTTPVVVTVSRRRLFFAHQGHVRRRHHGEQTEQALCLTLVTNAVVLFNTVYLQKVLGALRQDGHDVDDQAAAHLSPALHQHINFYGSYSFDVERELCECRGWPGRAGSAGWCWQHGVTLENTGRFRTCLSFDWSPAAASTGLAHSSWLDQELVRLRT